MLSIRKVKTASGSIAVQVVQYSGHKSKLFKHIGSGKEEAEVAALMERAKEWIRIATKQSSLFYEPRQKVLFVERGECISVTHEFARQFLLHCIKECGLSGLSSLLLDLAMMRLIEPTSKRRTIELLSYYFGISYSQRIYRNIPKLIKQKTFVEQCAYSLAVNKFREPFYFILYDVTTLYFETGKSDDLRLPGFSKDNKPQQPQIVIGLLVTQSGFPLAYEVFAGNTFEGKTMLPIIEQFINLHKGTKPVIVADAAMLSQERLNELKDKNISYIVGARLTNAPLGLIKQIQPALQGNQGTTGRFPSLHGDLVCDFSIKRYKKELYDLNRQIKKAEELVAQQSCGIRTKFVKKLSKERVELNKSLIEKHRLLLGIKGYCTDIPPTELPNEKVIDYYHRLWRVEQSFRMSKSDLETRPIFHHKQDAVRAHVLICFVALIIEKYLELTTKLSLRQIRFLIWNITETHIQDKLTKEVFIFRSPTDEIMQSSLATCVKQWNLLPH
jgi:transposase